MSWQKTFVTAAVLGGLVPWSPPPAFCSQADANSTEGENLRTYFGKPYIVTASRLSESPDHALKSVTVITREDIARQQAVTVEEVLRNVPGVSVQSSGGTYGSAVDVRLRGADTDQVLVMIDGVQVNSTWLALFSFSDLPVDNVERIEVVRGPASALYGSDAVGGVINIISKRGQGSFSPTLVLEGGSLGTARAAATVGGGAGALDYSLTLSRLRSDGLGNRDGYDNTSFSGRLGVRASKNKTISLASRYTDGRKQIPYDFKSACDEFWNCTNFQTNDPNNSLENRLIDLSLRLAHDVGERWDYSVVLGQVNGTLLNSNDADPDPRFSMADPDTVIPYVPTIQRTSLNTRRSTAETQHNLRLMPWGVTSLGIEAELEEAEREDFSNFTDPDPQFTSVDVDRTNVAYFAQQKFELGPPTPGPDWKEDQDGALLRLARSAEISASAALGIRVDDNSQFGAEASPKAAAGISFGKMGTSVAIMWSQSFNAPSLTDLYFPGFSNPDLKPEISSTTELTLRQKLLGHRTEERLSRAMSHVADLVSRAAEGEDVEIDAGTFRSYDLGLTLEASYFKTDYDDLIAYDMAFFKPGNVARAKIEGFEAVLSADLKRRTGAAVTYTYLDAKKWSSPDAESERLSRRPRNLFNLAVWTGPFGGVSGRLDLNTTSSVDDRFNFVGADGVIRAGDSPGFTKVDLALSYSLTEKHKVHLKLENLFDEEYEEVKGYPAPGRTLLAGVTISI